MRRKGIVRSDAHNKSLETNGTIRRCPWVAKRPGELMCQHFLAAPGQTKAQALVYANRCRAAKQYMRFREVRCRPKEALKGLYEFFWYVNKYAMDIPTEIPESLDALEAKYLAVIGVPHVQTWFDLNGNERDTIRVLADRYDELQLNELTRGTSQVVLSEAEFESKLNRMRHKTVRRSDGYKDRWSYETSGERRTRLRSGFAHGDFDSVL